MIYFALTHANRPTVIKRLSCALLVLPLCLVLSSCDSASSNDSKGLNTKVALSDNLENADTQDLTQSLQDTDNYQSDADAVDKVAEGQSLIAAAQSVNDAHTNQSLMSAESNNRSNTLQATLMGDYGGIVPCGSCSSIDVTLNLFSDGTVLKTSVYNNPENPRGPLTESGVYRQDNDTIIIVYEDKKLETYNIQDNHLLLLDEDDNANTDYILSRQ
ncbi:copper resistance protein NlpE N-terminal domain-containing protein [Psychrobacter sp. B38]|uniref:copper resistance protein NlpE N-terminal domain-containing protein n=1 Tax=Psychrobacter sp. B38 TaxID=3143538 RepID=UPI00321093E1